MFGCKSLANSDGMGVVADEIPLFGCKSDGNNLFLSHFDSKTAISSSVAKSLADGHLLK